MTPVFANNKEKYLFHLKEVKKFDGFATQYCKLHDLKPDLLNYYKRRLPRKPIVEFARIKVEPIYDSVKRPVDPVTNIDPEWLAKLIHNLVKI